MKTIKISSVLLLFIGLCNFSFAQEKKETFKVSGECGTCKKKIEKAAKTAGASYALWDVKSKVLTVKYNSTSTNAAKIFGMFPKKGTIAVGSDADIILFDANEKHTLSASTHHMNVDYSAYEGMKVKGVTKTVISRGRVVIEDGKYVGKAGDGEFLKRGTFSGNY